MALYAQHGYGKSDKISKGINDGSIDGVILSPKAERPENLIAYINELRSSSNIEILLDPQLYVLAYDRADQIGKLNEYEFYIPEGINKKFLSIPQNIDSIVDKYFRFQTSLGINKIIIPSILIDNFDSRLSQIALTIANAAINQLSGGIQLLLSLCISEDAFKDLSQVQDFLDIISLFDVKGFYIIIDREEVDIPNIIDETILTNIMYFMYNLSYINEFEVILGYGDYIGLPLYCSGINAIATGWFNTLRRFCSTDLISRAGGRRPNRRYFSDKLLNSLLFIPEIQYVADNGLLNKILSNSQYNSEMFNDLSGIQWSDAISCLHNWSSIKKIINNIDSKKEIEEKINYMMQLIREAKQIYAEFQEDFFDSKSKSNHLDIWERALDNFLIMIKES